MILLKLLMFTLTLHEVVVHLDATSCPKGQKVVVTGGKNRCEDCPSDTYQPVENTSQRCMSCTSCDKESGSVPVQECKKEMDRICRCRGHFVPSDNDSSTCMCAIGFGLDSGECLKCEDGYFSTSINSPCQKLKNLTSDRLPGGAQTEMHTTATTSAPRRSAIPENKVLPLPPNTGIHIGVGLIFGIASLLALIAVTLKLYATPHMETQPAEQKNDSLCQWPIEESGDGSRSSLKLNQMEP